MDPTRKSRYVSGGNLTDPPLSMTYAIVVSCDSVRLALLIAVFNDLYVLAGDIHNAYSNAPKKQKVFLYAGDEWKFDQGKVVIIYIYLYGLNYSALAWRKHRSEILGNHLGLQSYLADTGVWLKAATYKTGNEYYTYILVYVDDLLIVEKDPRKYMAILESKYTLKPSFIGEHKV